MATVATLACLWLVAGPPVSATSAADLNAIYRWAYSPDGTKIAFAGQLANVEGIYLSDRDGSDLVPLAQVAPGFFSFDSPTFAPDGQTIAFTAKGAGGFGDVYLIGADGSGLSNLTNSADIHEEHADWSPDGASIVVASGDAASGFSINQVRAVDPTTGDETLLANPTLGAGTPVYTADGSGIVLTAPDGLGSWQVYEIPATGGAATQLTTFTNGNSAGAPVVSRAANNSGRIAFTVNSTTLYTMAADGTGLTQEADIPGLVQVQWSPNGHLGYLTVTFDEQTGDATYALALPNDQASADLSAGGSLSTTTEATLADPVAVSVSTPVAGTVSIDTSPAIGGAPGFEFVGQQVDITAPAATVDPPLVFVFLVDATVLAANGVTAATIAVFRNGVLVDGCDAGAGSSANPDPCVASRVTLGSGDAELTVRTSHASSWNFGAPQFVVSGFFPPVDNRPIVNSVKAGSAVPVRFSLGGDRGLAVFDAAYPRSATIACSSTANVDAIEETATRGQSALSYDASTGRYTYVWSTDKAWSRAPAGPCRQLVLRFTDGSELRANFKFK